MINFAAAIDRELLAELKEASLVTPIVLEAIHGRLDDEEHTDLNEFLLAGADLIDEREWLIWMIRRHGCYRFGPVRLAVDAGGERWVQAGLADAERIREAANLPYAVLPVPKAGQPACMVAVLRPDLPVSGLRAAATLRELRQLRADWARVR